MNLTACQVGGGWPWWPLECRGLDDSKTMQPYYFIRRADDDPMVRALDPNLRQPAPKAGFDRPDGFPQSAELDVFCP
jgi:hypothetical protein